MMRKILIVGLIFAFQNFGWMNRDKEQALKDMANRGISVSQIGKTVYRLDYPSGKAVVKDFGDYSAEAANRSLANIDSTIIDLRTIDTSLYSSRYKFWQEVDVSDADFSPVVIGDINKNNKSEIYGYTKLHETPLDPPVNIYEIDSTNVFKMVYQYPEKLFHAQTIFDINNDGINEVLIAGIGPRGGNEAFAYRPNQENGLPTIFSNYCARAAGHAQMNHPTLGDFDKDGKIDIVYNSSPSLLSFFIDEYNPGASFFDSVYRLEVNKYINGHSVGDFDMDGKTEIVGGSSDGDVYVIEAQGIRSYQKVWQGSVTTHNAYLHFNTNDIDENGKPEFWVGGDAFYNGVATTRFTCFEMNGDNNYTPVARIDLVGVFSFFAGNCFAKDIDHDGREELFICIDQHVIILKFAGSPNHHAYDIFYLKRNDLLDQNSVYEGATLSNVIGDSRDELFITLDLVNNIGRKEFTYVYKPDFVLGVKNYSSSTPLNYRLLQNYPNPFNSTTKIRFEIPQTVMPSRVTLKVYNVLGEEIRLLLEDKLFAGEYTVEWNGKNKSGADVSSGIYFICLEAPSYKNTVKALLIK